MRLRILSVLAQRPETGACNGWMGEYVQEMKSSAWAVGRHCVGPSRREGGCSSASRKESIVKGRKM